MRLFEKKYSIRTRNGSWVRMTATQLCERIKEDSKSDYNWIARASELVRVCKMPGFPTESAITIKAAILNCFANIEHRANAGGDRYRIDPSDEKAVEYCYNSLYGIDAEIAVSARRRYLSEMITMAAYLRFLDPHYHRGQTYRNLLKKWRKSKIEEYISKKNIVFEELVKKLKEEFLETVKKAEEDGEFEEDDKAESERMKAIFGKLLRM